MTNPTRKEHPCLCDKCLEARDKEIARVRKEALGRIEADIEAYCPYRPFIGDKEREKSPAGKWLKAYFDQLKKELEGE